jgi:hypothetical protein
MYGQWASVSPTSISQNNLLWEFFYIFFITILQKYMVRHKFCKTIEDHVWFEDRWMVASLCDE